MAFCFRRRSSSSPILFCFLAAFASPLPPFPFCFFVGMRSKQSKINFEKPSFRRMVLHADARRRRVLSCLSAAAHSHEAWPPARRAQASSRSTPGRLQRLQKPTGSKWQSLPLRMRCLSSEHADVEHVYSLRSLVSLVLVEP